MQKKFQLPPYSGRITLSLLLFCLFGIPTFAQKEAQTWYFGKNAGLSFSTNPPTVLTDGQINTREGVSSISDRTSGQLLFYSEGTNVWNRNHGIMTNGSGLLGDYSSTQSSVVVPNPGNPNRYYLFTTALSNGVRYSEIDMTMAGGLGDVIPATKNTLLLPGTSSSEKLIAVQHCNKQDYWVITHTTFSNTFYVYLITTAGVQAPATYSIGYTIGGSTGWEATGYLKLSPDGSKLAHVIGPRDYGFLAQVEILNFNDKTGVIAGPVVSINNIDYPYGTEFSQSGRYLYISELWGKKILQYNITDPAVNTTRTQITSSTNLQFGALQLGPDNKIYVTAENGTDVGYPYLGVINTPDMQGAGSGYVQDAINLNGRSTLIGLPTFNATFLQKDTASVQLSGNCTGSNISFSLTNTSNTDSVKWTFGDASDSSMLLSPAHTYAVPGAYNIQTIIYRSCNANDTISKVVTVSSCSQSSVIAGFTAPDTVCINNPVNITNTSTGASSYFWNFCTGNLNNPPIGTNLGNIGGAMTSPVYIDYVEDNGNYYGFVTDNHTGKLFRLDFGNNLLNTPTMHDFGNFGGQIPIGAEGLQIVKNEGKWYVILVGGDLSFGVIPYIIKVELGTSITNPSPLVTNWGNIGYMAYPHDLYVFSDNGHWYGLTVNYTNNTFTRFDFTNSFSNTPTAVNLGNIGNLNGPTGIHAINDGGRWYAFVTNAISSTLTRLDFGNSLLNVPTGQSLGNIGGLFHTVWDVYVVKYCGELLAYLINADMQHNDLIKLNFNNDITNNAPAGISFGNVSGMLFPHCLSKIFRAGADLYTFVANVNNRSLSRIRFPGCTNASVPNSTAQTPPPIIYNTPGTYNINLTVDDGLPTQSAYCKQVVVLPAPVASPTRSITLCDGEQIKIGSGAKNVTYLWNTGATTDSIDVTNPGTYWVEVNSFGCKATDTFRISPRLISDFSFKQDVCDPYSIQFFNASIATVSPWWDMGDGVILSGNTTLTHTYTFFGGYKVRFSVSDGVCRDTITKIIPVNVLKENIVLTPDTVICDGITKQLRAVQALSYCWFPATYLDNPAAQNPVANTPQDITYYLHSETIGNNLISNGDFSAGNTGFGSDYIYTTANSTVVGVYAINSNPSAWNSWAAPCADHTGGNGNMIMFDGANIPGQKVWYTTISITPNTNFAFSSWIQSIHSTNPARLQFFINGKLLGNIFSASPTTCQWQQFYEVWNSGDATTAEIAIVNQNTFSSGNDFALDDISFAPVFIKRDSVVIKVDKPIVKTNNDTTVCSNKPVPLFATGAATYTWSPAAGLSNPAIDNPIATPVSGGTTTYIVTGITMNGCVAKDTVLISAYPKLDFDFSYQIDACSPLALQFTGLGSTTSNAYWDFGDNTTATGNTQVSHLYAAENTYKVRYSVNDGTCTDTIAKLIPVRILKENIVLTSDTVICDGTTKQLQAVQALSYCWFPSTYLDNPAAQNPVTSTPQDITYYLHSEATGNNLIVNGDFSAGNTGFTSEYVYAANNTVEGEYFVGPNPLLWNPGTNNCRDHTTGNGNMLLVNGNPVANQSVWEQTINVVPNTNYAFSTWIQSISQANPAQLQFSINGKDMAGAITASTPVCNWLQFYTTWNSGNNTTALISIVNKNTIRAGNDFALDDISFAQVFIKRDSVVIKVDKPVVKTNNDTTVCSNKVVPLFTTGAATYSWSPAAGLSNPAIANPVATPTAVPTQYIVTGTTTNGCVAKDTVLVSAFPKPAITKTQDTLVCRNTTFPLFIGGGVSYAWSSAGQLSGDNSDRPIVSVGTSPVTYQVVVTDSYFCVNLDSVQVSVRPYPVFRAMTNQAICAGASQVMYASGGDTYQWSPAQWLSNPFSPSPVATPDATTLFSVYIQESTCSFDTTINMLLTVNPIPVLTVDKANDVNCNTPTAQLRVTGAMRYTWSPATGLDDPNKANPVAAIDTTTQYKVSGVNQFGCSSNAYVEVKATKDGIPRFVIPNSFTPNGDRKNDCFGIQRWGNAIVQEFTVYNRWGQKVFQANNPNQCWDGTFNGKPQDTGGYVYVIRARTLCGEVTTKGVVMLIR